LVCGPTLGLQPPGIRGPSVDGAEKGRKKKKKKKRKKKKKKQRSNSDDSNNSDDNSSSIINNDMRLYELFIPYKLQVQFYI
jgi:hypothetical protein